MEQKTRVFCYIDMPRIPSQVGELLRGHRGQRLLVCPSPVEDEERQRDSRDDAPGQQAVELALHSLTSKHTIIN